MSTLTAVVYRLPALDLVAELDLAYGMEFTPHLNEPGVGKLTLPLDAPYLYEDEAEPLWPVRISDVVVFRLDDQPVFSILIEKLEDHQLDRQGGSAEWTRISGRWSVLEWAVIGPSNGPGAQPVENDRLFSWQVIQFDDSAFVTATEVGLAFFGPRGFVPQAGYPAGAPPAAVDARWIWSEEGDDMIAPVGVVYARKVFTVATEGEYIIGGAIDNYGRVWVDGQLALDIDQTGGIRNYLELSQMTMFLSAGDHVIAVEAYNGEGGDENPGGIYVIVAPSTAIEDPILLTDDTWLVLGYPAEPPGMTPGLAVLIALEEAQDRGAVTFVTPTWTADLTTDETAWPVVADIATKVGSELLTFLQELSVPYIDWRLRVDLGDPDLKLDLFAQGDLGTATGVSIEPSPVIDPRTGSQIAYERTRT